MYCCTKVTEDVIWIGINDRKTERFENYLPLDNGVTYNSYLIYDEKTCAIDAVEAGQSGSFYAKLENSLGGRNLDYLVVNHVEPDHSGDRKSTRLNSSHANISYAVFCLKKKKNNICT